MAILRQHEMTLRQGPTPYRASFFTGAHYRNSSEGLPSGLSSPPRMLPFLKSFLKRPWQSRQMDPPQTDEMLNRQRESLLVLMTLVRSPRVKKAASSAVLPRWSHDGFLNLLLPCVCCLQDRTYALKSPHRSTNPKKRFHSYCCWFMHLMRFLLCVSERIIFVLYWQPILYILPTEMSNFKK